MTGRRYQPYFVAYAYSQGFTSPADAQAAITTDTGRFRGHLYMEWIQGQWREWAAENGVTEIRSSVHGTAFGVWLASRWTCPPVTAYVVSADGYGDPELLVIPGEDGSGQEPILTLPIEVDEDGNVTSDVDGMLRDHGWVAYRPEAPAGHLRQPDRWEPTVFGSVASVRRI